MSETDNSGEWRSIEELLRLEQDGSYTEGEMFAAIFRQLNHRNIEAIIDGLPTEVRVRFVAWARANYDNAIDPADGFDIGGEGFSPVPTEAFDAIRRWFAARQRTST